jgi:hypothetical protein
MTNLAPVAAVFGRARTAPGTARRSAIDDEIPNRAGRRSRRIDDTSHGRMPGPSVSDVCHGCAVRDISAHISGLRSGDWRSRAS